MTDEKDLGRRIRERAHQTWLDSRQPEVRPEKVFEMIDETARGKNYPAIIGIIEEGRRSSKSIRVAGA